jgi:hypothetical protein
VVASLRQPSSTWAVAWDLLTAFSQIYSENCEQKAYQKVLQYLQFGNKSPWTLGAKESMDSEEINTIKKKPRILASGQ